MTRAHTRVLLRKGWLEIALLEQHRLQVTFYSCSNFDAVDRFDASDEIEVFEIGFLSAMTTPTGMAEGTPLASAGVACIASSRRERSG
jgi:hypothetical protein